jgi:hypothetical protein
VNCPGAAQTLYSKHLAPGMIILAVEGYVFLELRKEVAQIDFLSLNNPKTAEKGIADIAVLDGFIVVSSDAYQAGY